MNYFPTNTVIMDPSEFSDHLNLAHLDDMTGGDNGLRADILGFFVENAEGYVGELENLASDQSSTAEDFRAMSHKLKGAARAVGAYKMAALAEECEGLGDAEVPKKQAVASELKVMLGAISAIASSFSGKA